MDSPSSSYRRLNLTISTEHNPEWGEAILIEEQPERSGIRIPALVDNDTQNQLEELIEGVIQLYLDVKIWSNDEIDKCDD